MKKEKVLLPLIARVFVQSEGKDEWGNRYFKLAVKDSQIDLPPFSLDQISSDPQIVYSRLSNAGVSVLSTAAKTQVLNMLQVYCGLVLRHPAGLIQAANFTAAVAF